MNNSKLDSYQLWSTIWHAAFLLLTANASKLVIALTYSIMLLATDFVESMDNRSANRELANNSQQEGYYILTTMGAWIQLCPFV